MTVVFAKTRYHYDSYIDFWRLVEAAGFDTTYVDTIELADDTKTYVFSPINGEVMELLPSWKERRCKTIWWNLERPSDDTLTRSLDAVRGAVDAIWVSDRGFAARVPSFTWVPIAGDPRFGSRVLERSYDICHLAYLWGRRLEAVNALRDNGYKVAPEAWGRAQQDVTVAKSHLMLNLHQYDGMDVIAPIRFAVAASYAIPIVSETFADRLCDWMVIAQGNPAAIVRGVPELLRDPDRLRAHGAMLFERLCVDTDFGREIDRATGKERT